MPLRPRSAAAPGGDPSLRHRRAAKRRARLQHLGRDLAAARAGRAGGGRYYAGDHTGGLEGKGLPLVLYLQDHPPPTSVALPGLRQLRHALRPPLPLREQLRWPAKLRLLLRLHDVRLPLVRHGLAHVGLLLPDRRRQIAVRGGQRWLRPGGKRRRRQGRARDDRRCRGRHRPLGASPLAVPRVLDLLRAHDQGALARAQGAALARHGRGAHDFWPPRTPALRPSRAGGPRREEGAF
mmetsp:Transcript_47072/g.136840  ORF Transcript_47072/g.136840 Transcript_47072/m.136840 type:complete len:237 (+) Transcript_47072:387-1097(+)